MESPSVMKGGGGITHSEQGLSLFTLMGDKGGRCREARVGSCFAQSFFFFQVHCKNNINGC